jgi:hypothetical protein
MKAAESNTFDDRTLCGEPVEKIRHGPPLIQGGGSQSARTPALCPRQSAIKASFSKKW